VLSCQCPLNQVKRLQHLLEKFTRRRTLRDAVQSFLRSRDLLTEEKDITSFLDKRLDGVVFDDDKKAICFLEFAPTVCPGLMNVSPEQGGHCPVRGPARRHLHVSALCTCSCPALRTRLHPAQIAGKVSRLLWLAASHVCVA
jgi:hypothetical protein